MPFNTFHQEVGQILPDYIAGPMPDVETLEGRYCCLEHIKAKEHLDDIADFYWKSIVPSDWTYMYDEPFDSKEAVEQRLMDYEKSKNPYFFAIREKVSNKVLGTFSLMAINPQNRSVEVGRVIYAPTLQKTRAGTEAQYLLMKYVFEELGYRRYEWKCDSLNRSSANAARRLGFKDEGLFRRHAVYKGRSRDTLWLSMIEEDWQLSKVKLEKWLEPTNFDQEGNQGKSLSDISTL